MAREAMKGPALLFRKDIASMSNRIAVPWTSRTFIWESIGASSRRTAAATVEADFEAP
jgi:hypothetical protein